jgi:hypothetical protein
VSTHATELATASGERVTATLYDSLALDDLFDADKVWTPEKIEIIRNLTKRNVPKAAWPQSLHWSWTAKAVAMKPYVAGPLSSHRLFGIQAQDNWQGLLLARCVGHHTRIAPVLEFVEIAPWNWRVPETSQEPRLKGIGSQLFELAVRWSDELGFRGRIGLHSLPQADAFYGRYCSMKDFGADPKCHDLRYFELDELHARAFLDEEM